MIARIWPWALAFFLAYYTLTEPGHVGHFLGWLLHAILHAFGQLAIAVDSL